MSASVTPSTRPIVRHEVIDHRPLHSFIEANARHGLGADPRFLLGLARGPESVFDLHDERGRALVAVLTDRCDNSGGATELMLLACREACLDERLIATCVERAIAAAIAGPHGQLELVVDNSVRPHREILMSRGFEPRFEMVAMEQRRPHVPVGKPTGWAWSDVVRGDIPAVVALGRAAFAGHPGVNFPPGDCGSGWMLERSPPVRLLRAGGRLIGSVSVRRDTVEEAGMIEIIQRHPDYARRGVGAILMTEALRLLAVAECRTVRLDASVQNRRALTLYERFGFQVTEVKPVFGRATPSSAPEAPPITRAPTAAFGSRS